MVDGEHVNRLAFPRQTPARPALGRVPGLDGGRAADVREPRERAEGGEAFVNEAICAAVWATMSDIAADRRAGEAYSEQETVEREPSALS